ncbi:response regulator transcription factor [Secundilactobacillus kimchicus]|uniref:response regulator transcription factor n=1 Tax=Secundilactobacillus kimchicus TaxID=528209 RepID=UPI0024A7FC76|nr:response regulator transcription factor [Secundilactobacillus kimchicus]
MYRVLVVDDHPLIRAGLIGIINQQENFKVVAEASNGTDACTVAAKGAIDLITMDISMPPGECGLSATRRIHEKIPNVKILVISMHEEHDIIDTALHFGALGYLLKTAPTNTLIEALNTVAKDQFFVDEKIVLTQADFSVIDSNKADAQLYYYNQLSQREQEVLPLMVLNCSNKEIAGRLYNFYQNS